jgi:chaperonin GroEL (HSP60 family)
MTDQSTKDNVIYLKTPQDRVFHEAYSDAIMAITDIIQRNPSVDPQDWVSMLSSMAGQMIFNADRQEYKANFIRATAGLISGISKQRKAHGLAPMETIDFLRYVQLR